MRAGWLVPVLALTLTACGSGDPRAELRGDVEAVTLAANEGSAAALRSAVEELRSTIRAQVASDELDRPEGERLNAIALRLLENADLLEAGPSPVPTVEPEAPEPTEEPEVPEPTEEPEPEPTEEPEPEPEPEPTEEPEPEETVEVVVPPVEESPPSMVSQGGGGSSPAASPAA